MYDFLGSLVQDTPDVCQMIIADLQQTMPVLSSNLQPERPSTRRLTRKFQCIRTTLPRTRFSGNLRRLLTAKDFSRSWVLITACICSLITGCNIYSPLKRLTVSLSRNANNLIPIHGPFLKKAVSDNLRWLAHLRETPLSFLTSGIANHRQKITAHLQYI